MNAVELLEHQHTEMLHLLERLEKSSPGAARTRAFRKLHGSLLAHMSIEEALFYPALVTASEKDGEPLAEGYEEHSVARTALARCARSLAQARLFQVRIGVLKELISHHVKEERSAILPQARKSVSRGELDALGARMQAHFKDMLGAHGVAAGLERMSTTRAQRALRA